MACNFFVSVEGPRGDVWRCVLGANRVPVLSPMPIPCDLRKAGRGVELCYLLNVHALTHLQRDRLIGHLADTFESRRKDVVREMLDKGVPILAEGCTVTIAELGRWI